MSFDYNKITDKKHEGTTQWAAYSDLFMVLAFVFLLLYMVTSLRSGMESMFTYAEVADDKQELELYKTIKDQYLKEEASLQEQLGYEEILNQISLLESEARENKNRLSKEFSEQKVRESSLNKYQQLIRNLMNANAIAKADAARRMSSARQENASLEKEINYKKRDLESLENRLQDEEEELSSLKNSHSEETQRLGKKYSALKSKHDKGQDNIASLEDMLKMEAAEKDALNVSHNEEAHNLKQKFRQLKGRHQDGQDRLAQLEGMLRNESQQMDALKSAYSKEKRSLKGRLEDVSNKHLESQKNLAQLERKLRQESTEMDALNDVHADETRDFEGTIDALTSRHNASSRNLASLESKMKQEAKEKFELRRAYANETRDLERQIQNLKRDKGAGDNRLADLEQKLRRNDAETDDLKDSYDDATDAMAAKLDKLKNKHAKDNEKLARLNKQNVERLAQLNADLDDARTDLEDTSDNLSKTRRDLDKKSKDLDKALELEKRRQDIAKRIQENFRNNGIVADVNSRTGDVILDFGDNYFDTDSHQLKMGMRRIMRKAIPVYAQSLFGGDMVSSVITSVEIIGFASPTYGGKPVDPTGLSAENRAAVNYNLDLSYRRARSIFEYVFDTDKLQFKHQETMVQLINVTGRSFFSEDNPATADGLSIEDFCGQYNCMKSQRVIIKFGLSEEGSV